MSPASADWATRAYTRDKVTEKTIVGGFAISFPQRGTAGGPPAQYHPRPTGCGRRKNAVFGAGYGLEAVNYFAPAGEARFEVPSFRRSNAFGPVGEECRAVRTAGRHQRDP